MFTLTSQARAVAAFALGFLLVTGALDRIGRALIATFDSNVGQDQVAAGSAVTLVLGVVLLWFAGQAAAAATETWAVALAQSGAVLTAVGLVTTLLTLAASLLQDGQSSYYL